MNSQDKEGDVLLTPARCLELTGAEDLPFGIWSSCLEGDLGHRPGQCSGWSAAGSAYSSLAVISPVHRRHRARIGHSAPERVPLSPSRLSRVV